MGPLKSVAAVIAALGVTAGLAACSPDPPSDGGPSVDTTASLREQLQQRPYFEDGSERYLAMLDQMRLAVTALVPAVTWKKPASAQSDEALCAAPFTKVEGAQTGGYDTGGSNGPIPDAQWPVVLDQVTAIAGKQGFTRVETIVDKPGHHVVYIHGQWGDSVDLGSIEAVSIAVNGPCLLLRNPRTGPVPTEAVPLPGESHA